MLWWTLKNHKNTQIIIKKLYFFHSSIKMGGKCMVFGDEKVKKVTFMKAKHYLR